MAKVLVVYLPRVCGRGAEELQVKFFCCRGCEAGKGFMHLSLVNELCLGLYSFFDGCL